MELVIFYFSIEGPRSRCYERTAVQTYDEDDNDVFLSFHFNGTPVE
jgi:hypothetical protein